jgi:UDP-glucose 4-epimerase
VRILVTGAAGFIGSHLCRRLVADGYDVVGLDDLSSGSLDNLADVPEIRFSEADLLDEAAVHTAAAGCDAILHHAARKSVARSIDEPGAFVDVNVRGTLNVLLAARDERATVVFASSSSAYGDQDAFPLVETLEPRPRSPYAATKIAGEALMRAWWHSYGVPTVSLRYFNAYGPGQDPASEYAAVVPRFVTTCLRDEPPVIYGDGRQARDFTYIDDVVEANILALRNAEVLGGNVLNAGGGREPTTVNELLTLVRKHSGASAGAIHAPPRPGDIRRSHADITRARTLIGYDPKVDIDAGVGRTVEWFAARI